MRKMLTKKDVKTIVEYGVAFGLMIGFGNTMTYLHGNFSVASISIGLISALSAGAIFTATFMIKNIFLKESAVK